MKTNGYSWSFFPLEIHAVMCMHKLTNRNITDRENNRKWKTASHCMTLTRKKLRRALWGECRLENKEIWAGIIREKAFCFLISTDLVRQTSIYINKYVLSNQCNTVFYLKTSSPIIATCRNLSFCQMLGLPVRNIRPQFCANQGQTWTSWDHSVTWPRPGLGR